MTTVAPFPWGEGIRRLSPPGQEQGSADFTPGSGLPVRSAGEEEKKRGDHCREQPAQGSQSRKGQVKEVMT